MSKNSVSAIEMIHYDVNLLDPVAYDVINSLGLDEPCFIIRIINNSDGDITISYDGMNDHDYLQAYSHLTLNFQTNSQVDNDTMSMIKGTHVYVRGTYGKFGVYIYLVGYYQEQY